MHKATTRSAGGRSRTAFLASFLLHGLLTVALAGTLTLAGAPAPRKAEIQSTVQQVEVLPEEPELPLDPTPAPPEDLLPESLVEPPPLEETARLFSPPAEPATSMAIVAPSRRVERMRPPAPPPVELPPAPPVPVRRIEPLVRTVAVAAPSRAAAPARGNRAPVYPASAQRSGWEGTVLLLVHVRPDGTVERVEILTSSGRTVLDREAIRAVSEWAFTPALDRGVPAAARIEVPVRFRL